MKTKLLLLVFFGLNFLSFGQECGTTSPANYQTYERTKQVRGFDKTNIELHPELCLNVYYHIVRESNGTGGIAESKLTEMTDLLNLEYNPHLLITKRMLLIFLSLKVVIIIREKQLLEDKLLL